MDTRTFLVVHSQREVNFPYCVEYKPTENWCSSACFKTYAEAHAHIVRKMDECPSVPWRMEISRSKS